MINKSIFRQIFEKHKKTIMIVISVILVITLGINVVASIGTISWIGTNKALGSPLLDETFNTENWNKWELIAFGNFLSNFTYPFIDDYYSAFGDGYGGSHGAGAKALAFGSGNTMEALKDLLNYAVMMQSANQKNIYFKQVPILNSPVLEIDANMQANIKAYKDGIYFNPAIKTQVQYYIDNEVIVDDIIDKMNSGSIEIESPDTGEVKEINVETQSINNYARVVDLFGFSNVGDPDTIGKSLTLPDIGKLALTLGIEGVSVGIIAGMAGGATAIASGAVGGGVGITWGVGKGLATNWDGKAQKISEGGPFDLNIDVKDRDVIKIDENTIGSYETQIISGSADTGLSSIYSGYFYTKQANGKENIILNLADPYDVSALSAWYSRIVTNQNYVKQAFESMLMFTDTEAGVDRYKLILDTYGNICVSDPSREGRLVVLYPACLNRNLTYDKAINLVNSTMVGSNYSNTNGSTLIQKAEAQRGMHQNQTNKYRGGTSPIGGRIDAAEKYIGLGNILLIQDTDTIWQNTFEYYPKYYSDVIADFLEGDLLSAKPINWKYDVVGLQFSVDRGIAKSEDEVTIKNKTDTGLRSILGGQLGWWGDTSASQLAAMNGQRLDSISQLFTFNSIYAIGVDTQMKDILYEIDGWSGDKYKLFDTDAPVVIPVTLWQDRPTGEPDIEKVDPIRRRFVNWLSEIVLKNRKTITGLGRDTVLSTIRNLKTNDPKIIGLALAKSPYSDSNSSLYSDFLMEKYGNITADVTGKQVGDSEHMFSRLVRVYPKTSIMRMVGLYFDYSCADEEFAVWAPRIYYTYLKWFGIIGGNNDTSRFSTEIFDGGSDIMNYDASKVVPSEEEMKNSLLRQAYAITNPTVGRGIRKEIMLNNFQDWIYDNYIKIVYGGSVINSNAIRVSTNRGSAGFLHIDNYYSNPFTSKIMEVYGNLAIVLIGIGVLIVLIIGLITKKGIVWSIISIIMIVNVVIVTPSLGDVVPYVSERIVKSIFNDRLNYWAASELIENYRVMNSNYGSVGEGNSEYNSQIVESLIKEFNTLYLDRSLMLKLDISKKITQTSNIEYISELMRMQSTQWLLQSIMRQFSPIKDDDTYKYVYVSMSEYFMGATKLYDLYNSGSSKVDDSNLIFRYLNNNYNFDQQQLWNGYTDLYNDYYNDLNRYREIASRRKNAPDKPAHTMFYLINDKFKAPEINLNNRIEDLSPNDEEIGIVQDIINNNPVVVNNMIDLSTLLEMTAGNYSEISDSVLQPYGYLWLTESPYYYFYMALKSLKAELIDINDPDISDLIDGNYVNGRNISSIDPAFSLPAMAYQIQGEYTTPIDSITGVADVSIDKSKNTVRHTFMRAKGTGYLKDFCDLRELFTNVLPYMYTMQILAGGVNGDSGVFGTDMIQNYPLYEGKNQKAWMFRSNWVTKLMEGKEYNTTEKIGGHGNERLTIEKSLIPQNYLYPLGYTGNPFKASGTAKQNGRVMVFSEDDMHDRGLNEFDLSVAELKILKFYDETERDITLLLNYINMDGMTTEIMYHMMALIATSNFCKIFSPGNVIMNDTVALYPQSVELRNISFDSIIRMMMLSATNDSTHVYGNTMKNVIVNADILSAIFLLIICASCVWVIPFIRNIIMALLLALGIYATFMQILASDRIKFKVTKAYIINLFLFLSMNIAFFGAIAMVMRVISPTDVLSIKKMSGSIQSPFIILLILLVLCALYLFGAFKIFKFTILNYKDMGAAAFSLLLSGIGEKIGGGFMSLGTLLSGNLNRSEIGINSNVNTQNDKDNKDNNKVEHDSTVMDNNDNRNKDNNPRNESKSGYINEDDIDDDEYSSEEIDRIIKDGRNVIANGDDEYFDQDDDSYE